MNKKVINILLSLCAISVLSLTAFAQSVGGGEWTVGYRVEYQEDNEDNKKVDIIYSRYMHDTKSHGASTQVRQGGKWNTDRICKQSGVAACSEQVDSCKGTGNHGHGFWHRCGIDIPDCNGAYGNFD